MRYSCARLGLLVSLLIASGASAVTMAWTPIGNSGNACDQQPQGCFGSVDYTYNIGTYEVTNSQYAEFLNAKAASDPFALYETIMGNANPGFFGGIARSGVSGSYAYSAIAGRGNMPATFISFYDALRFANWMNNGQGNGDTETGAYTLLGGTPTPSNGMTVTRNPGATIVLTSENEWYKAAYYDSSTTSYFDFPTGSNTAPRCSHPTATSNSANCGYVHGDLTPVGGYPGSASPYGTFDQAGNAWEWNEGIVTEGSNPCYAPDHPCRGNRGGALYTITADFAASARYGNTPTVNVPTLGFRLVLIPEPSTGLLVIVGLLGLAVRRRVRD